MLNNKLRHLCYSILLTLILLPNFCFAALLNPDVKYELDQQAMQATDDSYNQGVGMGSIIATVIKAFIGLLGIIFIVLIVYAGYSWMTAAGDEAKVNKAKETLQRAVIGLVIVLAAYSITYFVFSNLSDLSTTNGSNPI